MAQREEVPQCRKCGERERGKPSGRNLIGPCLPCMRKYNAKRRADRIANGQCIECKRATFGTHYCVVCSSNTNRRESLSVKRKRADRLRARKAARRAAGLCDRCDQPALDGFRLCGVHRKYQAEMDRRSRTIAKLRAANATPPTPPTPDEETPF